ncbi:hypothetical protein CK489_29115 [Bradyrhizobium sp. UFLA03-84]|nr:hypothetical protein CK489_29115 [Bradyrhizobium sp. UFLA03-84]
MQTSAAVREFERYVQKHRAEIIGHQRRLTPAAWRRLRFAASADQVFDQLELLHRQGVPIDLAEVDKLQDAKARALLWLHQKCAKRRC